MSYFKKFAWSGTALAVAGLMAFALMMASTANVAHAAVTVETRADATISLARNATTGSGVSTPVSLALGIDATELNTVGDTLVITAPGGWSFDTGSDVTVALDAALDAGALAFAATAVTPLAGTITFTAAAANDAAGTLTFTGIRVVPDAAGTGTANISIAGDVTAVADAGTLTVSTANVIEVTLDNDTLLADGSQGTTARAFVWAGTNPQGSKSTTFNSSIAGFGTTGDASTTVFTDAQGRATATYRGTGTTGTDQITVTTPSPNAAVGTTTATLTGPAAGVPTTLSHIFTFNNGRVAANNAAAPGVYTSPTSQTNVIFRVTDANGVGVDGQVIRLQADKGRLLPGFSADCTTAAANITTNTTVNDTTFGGTATTGPGRVGFTYCALSSAANLGEVTLTATNLTTTMAAASASLTAAGPPADFTHTFADGVLTINVVDAAGTPVANGTNVTVTMAGTVGQVSPTTAQGTVNGSVQVAVALTGTSGSAIVTVDDGAGTNTIRVNRAITLTTDVTPPPPPPGEGEFVPPIPAGGLQISQYTGSQAEFEAETGIVSCSITVAGAFVTYVYGAPAFVNAGFLASAEFDGSLLVVCRGS